MSWALGSLTVAVGLSLSCAGFSKSSEPTGAEVAPGDDSAVPTRVIATLRTRESELTITSAAGGVRYSLVDARGATHHLTLEQLQARDPNLYEVVKSATARSAGATGSIFLDARAEPEAPAPPIGAERNAPPVPGGH